MKALVISDIHSNICALEAIWERERDSDIIYCAGDLVDVGPFPKEVLAWVREHNVVCVQGNHDRQIVACYREHAQLDRMLPRAREWQHHNAQHLDEEDITFLEQLPRAVDFELDGIHYGMTHMYKGYNMIVSRHAFAGFRAETFTNTDPVTITHLIFGHTHRQGIYHLGDAMTWLNPGSASYRRQDDPDQTAHYLTITDGSIRLHRLAYDLQPLYKYVAHVTLQKSELDTARWFFGPRGSGGVLR
ncbi:MAG: metallophosphoesterase family protein [Chloroflexaceae bacterium]